MTSTRPLCTRRRGLLSQNPLDRLTAMRQRTNDPEEIPPFARWTPASSRSGNSPWLHLRQVAALLAGRVLLGLARRALRMAPTPSSSTSLTSREPSPTGPVRVGRARTSHRQQGRSGHASAVRRRSKYVYVDARSDRGSALIYVCSTLSLTLRVLHGVLPCSRFTLQKLPCRGRGAVRRCV